MINKKFHKIFYFIRLLCYNSIIPLQRKNIYLQDRLKNQEEEKRNEVIARLGENGIATNVHFQLLPLLTAYKKLGFKIENYPNAYNQYKNEISLPLHNFLNEDDVKYICESLERYL